jgi:hypothetical protein
VHRIFDTKFFVAKLPGYQAPLHDNVETTNSRSMNPAEAMRAAGDPGFERPRIEPSVELGADGRLYVHHATFDRPESV